MRWILDSFRRRIERIWPEVVVVVVVDVDGVGKANLEAVYLLWG